MRTYFPLVLALTFLGHVHANPISLVLTGLATAVIGPTLTDVIVRTFLKNGDAPVKLLQDPGTPLSKPNCTMSLSSDNPEHPAVGCKMSDDLDEYSPSSELEDDVEARRNSRRDLPIIELEAGQTYERHFNLSKYYDLSKLQPGNYQVHLNRHVRYEDDAGIHGYNIPEPHAVISFTVPSA